jgi:hypothetical protein
MAMHEFRQMLLVDTDFGRADVLFVEGYNHDYHYTVVLHESRALMTLRQDQIRVARSYSYGWGMTTDEMKDILNEVSQKTSSD